MKSSHLEGSPFVWTAWLPTRHGTSASVTSLHQPIVIPDVPLTLHTLADARGLIGHLPAEHRQRRYWQHVADQLEAAAASSDVADAVIALRFALMLEGIWHHVGE